MCIREAGGAGREETADLVVVCAGSRPNLDFLDGGGFDTAAGLDVDERLRTAAPGLLAAGDVARTLDPVSGERVVVALWSSARRQGRAAGLTMAGSDVRCPGDVPCNIQHAGDQLFASAGSFAAADPVDVDERGDVVAVLWVPPAPAGRLQPVGRRAPGRPAAEGTRPRSRRLGGERSRGLRRLARGGEGGDGVDDTERRLRAKLPGADTGIEVRKSVCAICDPMTQCGLDLSVRDGRIVKVEGSRENPHSRGTLCAKGAATRQYVYHEDRLLTPLRRTGPRGSGEFEPVSWDEALDEVVANLERVKAESGAGVGRLLRRLPQADAPVRAAPGAAVRLAQLLHRVERLLHGHGDGLQARVRADGRARRAQHALPARLELQPLPRRTRRQRATS